MTTATTAKCSGSLSSRKHRGCRCLNCYDAANAYEATRRRKIAYGTWQPLVDARPARAHVEQLHAQGMTWAQIAEAAGVHIEYLCQLRLPVGGKRPFERIRPDRAAALLAVELVTAPAKPRSNVTALGSLRRLRALRANGWPTNVLADRTGVARATLGSIITGARPTLFAATADTVTELYDDLHDQDPRRHGVAPTSADRAIRQAARLSWTPPRAWDNVDIDDPKAEPGRAGSRRYAVIRDGDRRRHEIVEDAGELIAQGLPRDVIAERIGASWDAIRAAHSRCGVPLPAVAS